MSSPTAIRLGPAGALGLALAAMTTLMYETLLARIFSVTLWYHFAFVVISIAMFGLSLGAMLVYLRPDAFPPALTPRRLAQSSLLFAWGIVFSYLTHLSVPITPGLAHGSPILGLYTKALTFLSAAVPFTLSGIAICLALTRFPAQVSRLYAADLLGGALGCWLMPALLDATGDASTSVFALAALAALGACCFARGAGSLRLARACIASTVALALFTAVLAMQVRQGTPLLTTTWVRGMPEEPNLYERWSSFARVTVQGNPRRKQPALGWGISRVYPKERKFSQLILQIDSAAGTFMTRFDGDLSKLDFLRFDITNLVHSIRRDARVAIIGSGAGRDVLSALAFGQREIVAIEYNGSVLDALLNRFGDYSGHLDRIPQVRFVNDEGRSFLAREREPFDIIQASFIDTWAATAAGAFALAENSLYTVDAWELFLRRLSPRGVMTFARWCNTAQMPSEIYRMVAMASEALRRTGIAEPRRHIALANTYWRKQGPPPQGTGVILVSREPFSDADLAELAQVTGALEFDLDLTPARAADPIYERLVEEAPDSEFFEQFPIDITPPSDDRPFFFQMLRLRDLLASPFRSIDTFAEFNFRAITILVQLFAVVLVITVLCLLVPLLRSGSSEALRGRAGLLVYFASIGLGFMLIEISQMQRLIVYLGHPSYALGVILFTLLLGGGLGSLSTSRADPARAAAASLRRLAGLLAALALYGLLTPSLLESTREWENAWRAGVGFGALLPVGVCLGMAFPLGMKLASVRAESSTAWLWGINGATSVCGSVLATAIALWAGFSASFWTGFACYVAAFAAFALESRRS